MMTYALRRLLLMVPTLVGVTVIAFGITRLVPGGPLQRAVMQMQRAGTGGESGGAGVGVAGVSNPTAELAPEAIEQLKSYFDLDRAPLPAYLRWLNKIVHLDLGMSYSKREPVWQLIAQRLPVSITFGLTGFVLAYLISVPIGIYKALHHGTYFDFTSSAAVFVGYSIPGWALGALLLVFFASGRFYTWFPLGDIRTGIHSDLPSVVRWLDPEESVSDEYGSFEWERLSVVGKVIDRGYHMLLPVFCYMLGSFATLTILAKNSLMDNLGQDYVRTAFAKGLSPRRVIFLHAMRNSLIPLATGLGHALSVIMAGSYLIEWVFNIDGIGYLGYTSLTSHDYTVVMGVLTINTALTLLGNLFSDLLYALIDPRIRFD